MRIYSSYRASQPQGIWPRRAETMYQTKSCFNVIAQYSATHSRIVEANIKSYEEAHEIKHSCNRSSKGHVHFYVKPVIAEI